MFSLLETSTTKLLIDAGTRWSTRDFLSTDDRGAFLGGHPQGQLGTPVVHLQGAQVMHQVPCFIGLNHVGKRWHWSAIQAGDKNLVQIAIAHPALEAGASDKVVRANGLIVAVGQCRGCRTIAPPFLSVTLPAFEFLKKFLAMLDAFHSQCRFGRNVDWITRLFRLPARRKRLDE